MFRCELPTVRHACHVAVRSFLQRDTCGLRLADQTFVRIAGAIQRGQRAVTVSGDQFGLYFGARFRGDSRRRLRLISARVTNAATAIALSKYGSACEQ